jgi:tetratricopeptide (TPR) repeat protein
MKKYPLRTLIFGIVSAILITLCAFFAIKAIINHSFITGYNKQNYNAELESKLLSLNIPESYLPYYNLGNVAYRRGDYNSAIAHYNEALTKNPPKMRECKIRINLALAMCNTIDFNHLDSQQKIDTALFILYKARDVLTEKGCASEEGHDGHNEDAQQLKEDIDRLIEMLENPEETPQQQDQQQEQEPQQDDGNSSQEPNQSDKEKRQQDQLDKNKKNALDERQKEQEEYDKNNRRQNSDSNSSGDGGEEEGQDTGYKRPW